VTSVAERARDDRKRFGIALVIAVVAATALGLYRLGRQSLWLDELFSMQVARAPWATTWSVATGRELHSGWYHVMTWPWVRVFGDSESGLRSLSIVFGVATVVVVMLLTRRLFGTRAALVAAPLFLIHAQTVHYFQEGRTYTLAMLLSSLATLVLMWALDDRDSSRRWLVYGAVAGIAVYAHLFVVFVIASHGVTVAVRRLWPAPRALLRAVVAFAALVVPLLLFASRGYTNVDWIPATTVGAVRTAVLLIVVGGGQVYWLAPIGLLWGWRLWSARRDPDDLTAITALLSWFVVPFVLAIGVSALKPLFVEYYLNVCVPAAAILTAAGVDALARRSQGIAAVGLAVLLLHNGRCLVDWYDGVPAKDDYRTAMAFACADARDDAQVGFGSGLGPARYYATATCGVTTAPRRLLIVVRSSDTRPQIPGWTIAGTRQFTGVDVVTMVPPVR